MLLVVVVQYKSVGVCHDHQITRSNYEKGNESSTDFAYALALIRRGYQDDDVRRRILFERNDWQNHESEKKRKS